MKLSELLNKFSNFAYIDEKNICILWIPPYLSGISSWVSSWLCYLSDNSDIWPVTRPALQVSRVPVLHVTSRHITASRPDWDWDRLRVTGPGFCDLRATLTGSAGLWGLPPGSHPDLIGFQPPSVSTVNPQMGFHKKKYFRKSACVGF